VKLDAYRRDDLLAQERKTVPEEIESLSTRRDRERDPELRRELERVVESKGKQWQTLRTLDARMKQAELRLEQTMTALSTVYGQVQLIGARDVDSGRAERLEADIREEIEQLDDLISSINEISEQVDW
jgi:seryl-tRNA synthetase